MLKFVLQKLLSKKWMVLSLLIGNLLMIGMASASPMYFHAVLQRTLTQNLGGYQQEMDRYPGMIYQELQFSRYKDATKITNRTLVTKVEEQFRQMIRQMDVPVQTLVLDYYRDNIAAAREVAVQGSETVRASLHSYSGLADHVEITHGSLYSDQVVDNTIDVIVSERTYVEQDLELGHTLILNSLTDTNEVPYKLRVVGVFTNKDSDDPYWTTAPDAWQNVFVMDHNVFARLFANPEDVRFNFNLTFYSVLDYTGFREENVTRYLDIAQSYNEAMEAYKTRTAKFYFTDTLKAYQPVAVKLQTTMTVLLVPIAFLLVAFIFMVSRQLLQMEENEISVFKSRGASKGQLIGIYLLQSLVIALVGVAGGVPIGYGLCTVLGASDAFLELLQRVALPVELVPQVWIFAGGAALFCVATMVLPVFRFANVTIVAHKREKSRGKKRTWWKILCVDLMLLGVSLYGWYQFQNQMDYLAEAALNNKPMDPMLYLYSALFMLGAALLVLRLIPLLVRLVFVIGKRWWSPSLYASFLRILRSNQNQGFLVVFLVLTVSMGMFNSLTARTINANAEKQLRYTAGAELVVKERWSSKEETQEKYDGIRSITYQEPDFGKYETMDGIQSVTAVLRDDATNAQIGTKDVSGVTLMGIHTKQFGETAWFDESLLPVHWYEYLNVLAADPNGVLVSSNLQETYGLQLGDSITYTTTHGAEKNIRKTARGTVYGFVDYWPGFEPQTYVTDTKGQTKLVENSLIVANLSQLQFSWGVTPYEVWIKSTGSTQFLYDYAAEHGLTFAEFTDVNALLSGMKTDPTFQATNGILTVGFIIVLVLCAAGFLIYWILSIQSRALQFGIFRAMGMRMSGVLGMLVNEQFFISGISIVSGVVVGGLSSMLYVPLIQIVYSAADLHMASAIVSQVDDFVRLGAVIGLMIVVCMIVLGVLISKMQITQALKLGED